MDENNNWWWPSSPSPRALFTAASDHEDNVLNSISEILCEVKASDHEQAHHDHHHHHQNQMDRVHDDVQTDHQQRSKGLSERIAERSGFNGLRLNTENVRRSFGVSMNSSSNVRSPYVVISPGFSPTTFLPSPFFVSTPLVDLSPANGKAPMTTNDGNGSTPLIDVSQTMEDKNVMDDLHLSSLAAMVRETKTKIGGPSSSTNNMNDHTSGSSSMKIPETQDARTSLSDDKMYNWSLNGQNQMQGESEKAAEGEYSTSESMEAQFDPTDAPMLSSKEGEDDDDDDDDNVTHGNFNYIHGGDGEEVNSPKPRKRKLEVTSMIGATRASRRPRIIVQTTSDVDVLDDGYRWRKYGQKIVKGNPNPRSYYKCTTPGCNVRKHIERASHDMESVITTYEGKHNHDVPPPRTSGHPGSTVRSPLVRPPVESGLDSRLSNPLGVRHHRAGPTSGLYFGMRQTGLANLYITGLSKLPDLPMNRPPVYVLPKVEPKAEPVSVPSLNMSNGSSVYREIMNRLSLGS